MRNKIVVLSIVIVVIASSGVIAQSDGLTWEPDNEVENKTADLEFSQAYSNDGDNPSQPGPNDNEHVPGLEVKNGIIYTLAYTDSTDGTYQYEGWAYDIENNYESIKRHPGTLSTTDLEMISPPLAFDVINGTNPREYGNGQNIVFANTVGEDRLVSDGDQTIESYVSEHSGGNDPYHVISDNSNDNTIVYSNEVTVDGEEMIIVQMVGRLFKHNTTTHENTELLSHRNTAGEYWDTNELTNNSFISYNSFTEHPIDNTTGLANYYNLETGNWSYIWGNIIGMNDEYIAISESRTDNNLNKWNNQTLIFTKEDFANILDGTSQEYEYPDLNNHTDLALKIPNPEGVREFEKGMYESGKWVFIDKHTEKAYVYPEDLSNLEATVEQPWRSLDGFQTGFKSYVQDGTIHLASFNDNEIEAFDTNVETEATGLCSGHLSPPVLETFWDTQNVCWLPIFMGTGILNTIYQWLILAILIAMPIASVTDSEIATMATIDGVLIIAMLIGRISPGYVAIAVLTTALLSLYGTRGGDVNIDVGGPEI